MKKITPFLLSAFLSIGFCACKKSANIAPEPQSLLVGKWIKGITIDTTTSAGNEFINTIGVPNTQVYYQFNNDGTGVGGYPSLIEEKFSYKTVNSQLHLYNVTALTVGTTNAYYYGPPRTETILKLSTTELILSERDTITDSSHTEIDAYSIYYSKAQ